MAETPDNLIFLFRVLHWLVMRSPIEDQICRCPLCLNPQLGSPDGYPDEDILTPNFQLGCDDCGWRGSVRQIVEAAIRRGRRRVIDSREKTGTE